jgi:hypothetical protein
MNDIFSLNRLKAAVLLAALTGLMMLLGHFPGGTNGTMIGFVLALVVDHSFEPEARRC